MKLWALGVSLVLLTGAAVWAAPGAGAWRSADGFAGWQVAEDGLTFDQRGPGSVIAADPVAEERGEVSFEFARTYGPWARLELRFRASGDEQSYVAAAVEPEARRLSLVRREGGRVVTVQDGVATVEGVQGGVHRLGYRIAGSRVGVLLDGRELLSADLGTLAAKGRVGLAAAYARVLVRGPETKGVPADAADERPSLADWMVLYGPTAWHAAPETESPAPDQPVTLYSAGADGGIVGECERTNFAVEMVGRFVEASSTWACFGLRPKVSPDGSSYYIVEVRGNQSRLVFSKVTANVRDEALSRDLPLPAVELNRWYKLRCEFVGDHITVELDGQRYLDLVDPRPLEKGRTAVSASYTTVQLAGLRHEARSSEFQFQTAEPPVAPYDPGPELPDASPRAGEDADYWYLVRPGLRVAVHQATGMLGGIWGPGDKPQCLARRVVELYGLETRQDAVMADGHGDRVERVVRRTPSEVTVRCVNGGLPGIAIEKRYALDGRTGRLSHTVRLVNQTNRPDVFVTLALRTVLDSTFRQEAQYTGGSYLGPLVPAASIRERVLTDSFKQPWATGITNGRPSWVLALNDALGVSLATFRYRVNGQYVLPWNAIWTEPLNNLYHTPAGWEMGVCTLALRPGEMASAEVDYTLFDGGLLGFYDKYRGLPEVAAMYARVGPRPTWLRDLKMSIPDTIQRALMLSEEGLLLRADSPFGVWGEPLARDAAGNDTRLVARSKELMGRIRAASPRVRAGLYTWAWSAAEKSEEMRDHPEWFVVRDKAGQPRNAYPMGTNYVRCLSAPGCLDDMLSRYRKIVRDYPEDFQYLDNDGAGVQVVDWEHLRVDQDYDWQRLHEGVLAAARSRSPETATFFNNRLLPQGDISFAELMPAEIQNTDWRRPANELYPIKVFQKRDPERVVSLLYSRPETEPSYTNYCVGLGLLPWMSSVAQLPFINAAFETRGLELMDAGLTPDWHRDLQTSVEAYPLRLGAAACVSFIGHDEAPQETQIAFDTARMGLAPGGPYSAWLFDLKDSREHQGRLTEKDQRLAYEGCNWADETVVATSFLGAGESLPARFTCGTVARPQHLRVLMVTHSPALVWSLNGRRTSFWLPDARGVSLRRGPGTNPGCVEVVCRCEAERAEVAVLVPQGRAVREVTVDGKVTPWAPESVGGAWLVRVGVARGAHRITVACAPVAETAEVRDVVVRSPQQVKAGDALTVRLSFAARGWTEEQGAVLRAMQGGVLIASAAPERLGSASARFVVRVPGSARPGMYDLAFDVPGAAAGDVTARVEVVPGTWQPPVLPGDEPAGEPVVKVWDVGQTVRGTEVLRAGTASFDHRGGTQIAQADVDGLKVLCGVRDDSTSTWGYGFCGFEVRGVKALTVALSNTFAEMVQNGGELGDRYLDSFAGFMVDYHTPGGYTKRVALGLGVMNGARPVTAPGWGKAAKPDECIAWSRTLHEKSSDQLTVNLAEHAPPDWDGQAWFSVGVDTVTRGLQIEATVVGSEHLGSN